MELRQLRYFVEVARLKSYSLASKTLFITQSTISQQISKLEEELGVELLARDTRHVALSDYGEQFYPCALQVLEDANGQAIGTDGLIVTASEGETKGTATIGHLLPGTYYLKEIKTADGYTLLVDPAVIIVNTDGTATIKQSEYKGGQPQSPEDGYLIVNNNTGTALPKTGGMGVTPFTVGGLALTLCALALLLEARRRQRRRGDVNP